MGRISKYALAVAAFLEQLTARHIKSCLVAADDDVSDGVLWTLAVVLEDMGMTPLDLKLVSTARNCLGGVLVLCAKRREWAQWNAWIYIRALQTKHALIRAEQGHHAILTYIELGCSSSSKAIAKAYRVRYRTLRLAVLALFRESSSRSCNQSGHLKVYNITHTT